MTIPATAEQAEAMAWLNERGLSPLQGFMRMREVLTVIYTDRSYGNQGMSLDVNSFTHDILYGSLACEALEAK